MTIDLDAIESIAKAATPGPWIRKSIYGFSVEDPPYDIKDAHGWQISFCFGKNCDANAAYIAAANPATMLELVAELRKSRAERDWLAEMVVCRHDACAYPCKCGGRPPCEAECVQCWLNAAREAVEKEAKE